MAGVLNYALTLDTSQMQGALKNAQASLVITSGSLQGMAVTADQAGVKAGRSLAAVGTGARSATAAASSMFQKLSTLGAGTANIVAGATAVGTAWKATSRFLENGGFAGALARMRAGLTTLRTGLGSLGSNTTFRRLAVAAGAAAVATLGIMASVRIVRAGFGALAAAGRTTFSAISSGAKSAGSAVSSITGASFLTPLAAIAAPLAAATIAFKSFTKAADFESMEAGFKTILGSGEAAKTMLKDIAAEAASTPYGINDLAQSARSLLAVTARDEITPTLRMIGDLASAAQRPITDLASMYAKIKGSDSVQGEDLNQLSDALPGSLQEFVKVLNVDSVKAVRKLGEEGRITGAALDQVFINLTSRGGIAFQAMQTQSTTTSGLISTLKDGFDALFVTLGTPLNDFLKPIIGNGSALLDELNTKAQAFFQILSSAQAKGNLGAVIGASLKLAFVDGINTLSGGLRSVVAYLAAALPPIFTAAVNELTSERSQIFFTSLFSGIGDILRSKLEAAAAAIFAGLGRSGVAQDLDDASKSSATRGENSLTTASAALATVDLGGVVDNLAASLKAADEAAKKAAAGANRSPLIDRGPAAAEFAAAAGNANEGALKQFLNPAPKPAFVGPPKPLRPQGPLLLSQPADGGGDEAPAGDNFIESTAPAQKRPGSVLNEAASQAARASRRSASDQANDARRGGTGSNTDRLALADLERRQSRPLSPAAAAEKLARGSSGADPGKSRREERAQAKEKAENPLLAAVNEIKAQLTALTTA